MRYLVGFFITIGLIILLIILLVRGGGKPKVPTTSKTLDSYASTSAEASLTIDGPINGQSIHRQIKITVSRDNVTYEEIKGYDGDVQKQRSYDSTENAFDSFLHALQHAGFTRGNLDKKMADEKGFCPLGDRYIFELTQDGNTIERFWATECGNPKTYLGNLGISLQLFKNQVPDYNALTQNVQL